MKRKRTVLTLFICVLIIVLTMPVVTSLLNNNKAETVPESESTMSATVASNGGNSSTTEVVSTESTSGSYDASLAVDSGGNIHVAWRDDTDYDGAGTDADIFYKRYVVGVGWTSAEVVSTESTGSSSILVWLLIPAETYT